MNIPQLSLLACLFLKKMSNYCDRWIVIVIVQNFNIAHYSKSIKGINSKLGILAHHDKIQLQDKGHNSESCSFGVAPF